ncbi:hypothetical protein F4777DRAFT_4356 [Nemania sp. FL0916]|nr:hypothetical protein F4777DRAFT_4356 [Nemania sp. FL0916]
MAHSSWPPIYPTLGSPTPFPDVVLEVPSSSKSARQLNKTSKSEAGTGRAKMSQPVREARETSATRPQLAPKHRPAPRTPGQLYAPRYELDGPDGGGSGMYMEALQRQEDALGPLTYVPQGATSGDQTRASTDDLPESPVGTAQTEPEDEKGTSEDSLEAMRGKLLCDMREVANELGGEMQSIAETMVDLAELEEILCEAETTLAHMKADSRRRGTRLDKFFRKLGHRNHELCRLIDYLESVEDEPFSGSSRCGSSLAKRSGLADTIHKMREPNPLCSQRDAMRRAGVLPSKATDWATNLMGNPFGKTSLTGDPLGNYTGRINPYPYSPDIHEGQSSYLGSVPWRPKSQSITKGREYQPYYLSPQKPTTATTTTATTTTTPTITHPVYPSMPKRKATMYNPAPKDNQSTLSNYGTPSSNSGSGSGSGTALPEPRDWNAEEEALAELGKRELEKHKEPKESIGATVAAAEAKRWPEYTVPETEKFTVDEYAEILSFIERNPFIGKQDKEELTRNPGYYRDFMALNPSATRPY